MLSCPTLDLSSPSNHVDLVADVMMISENAGQDNFFYDFLHKRNQRKVKKKVWGVNGKG